MLLKKRGLLPNQCPKDTKQTHKITKTLFRLCLSGSFFICLEIEYLALRKEEILLCYMSLSIQEFNDIINFVLKEKNNLLNLGIFFVLQTNSNK